PLQGTAGRPESIADGALREGDAGRPGGRGGLQGEGHRAGRQDHVAVQPEDPLRARRLDPGVALGGALGAGRDHPVGEALGDRRGAVAAVVVHDDELHVRVGLLGHRPQAGLDGAEVVARRDDDGDGVGDGLLVWHGHGSGSSGGSCRMKVPRTASTRPAPAMWWGTSAAFTASALTVPKVSVMTALWRTKARADRRTSPAPTV